MDQRNDLHVNDDAGGIENLDRSTAVIPEGTVLDNNWVIGKQIGSTEHAKIYSVTHKRHGDDGDDAYITYEARSYNLDSISRQVKSHRARAIRRISGRTVSDNTCNGLRVIIYRTGAVIQDKKDKRKVLPEDILVAEGVYKTPKQKTIRQQESDRLRQRSRRLRIKQERENTIYKNENEQLQGYQGQEGVKAEHIQPVKVDPNEFLYFEILHLANGDEKVRRKVSPATRSRVEDYLAAKEKEVEVDGEEDLLEFIAIKEREIVFLQRTNNKFKPILQNWREYLHYVTSQILRECKAGDGKQGTYDAEDLPVFKMRYKILSEGLAALPSLVQEAEEMVLKLQLKLRDARQAREKREAKQALKLEKKRLGKQIKNLEKWVASVTVGSPSYYEIRDDIISAKRQLEMLEVDDGE